LVTWGLGYTLTYLLPYYQSDFTTVSFEQRFCRKTYFKDKSGNVNVDIILKDLDEVVNYAIDRLGFDRVIIVGQSWCNLLGIGHITMHPEKVNQYIGIGQVVDLLKEQKKDLIESARAEKDKIVINALKVKQKAYSAIDTLNVDVPGIDCSNMSWLRGMINSGFKLNDI